MSSRVGRLISFSIISALVSLSAMGGTAWAKHYVITSTSQISPKVLKALQGRDGAPGAAGAQGAAGSRGEVGLAGSAGARGPAGPSGPAGEEGAEGAEGEPGKDGSPWTAGGFLPKGATEMGLWAAEGPASAGIGHIVQGPLSFNIPLEVAPVVHVIESGAPLPEGCKGTLEDPGAEPGNLCIFVFNSVNTVALTTFSVQTGGAFEAAGKAGTIVVAVPAGTESAFANGTWAVTGD